jgi:membrane protein implicated in regulation of membrane protease activity
MDNLIQLSFYISLFSGGLLILLLLLSIIGGMDLDFDVGDTDVDTHADAGFGGLGIIKSGLTFLTIGSYVVKLMLAMSINPILTIFAGIVGGVIAVIILSWFLKLLLKNQSNVNWEYYEAEGKTGKVYLKIPSEGTGIVNIEINGVTREIKAKSMDKVDIPTGTSVLVHDVDEEVANVTVFE